MTIAKLEDYSTSSRSNQVDSESDIGLTLLWFKGYES